MGQRNTNRSTAKKTRNIASLPKERGLSRSQQYTVYLDTRRRASPLLRANEMNRFQLCRTTFLFQGGRFRSSTHHPSTNQRATNQLKNTTPTNKATDQPITPPTNQPASQPASQPAHLAAPKNQPTLLCSKSSASLMPASLLRFTNHGANQTNRPTKRPNNRPINQ